MMSSVLHGKPEYGNMSHRQIDSLEVWNNKTDQEKQMWVSQLLISHG